VARVGSSSLDETRGTRTNSARPHVQEIIAEQGLAIEQFRVSLRSFEGDHQLYRINL